MANKKRATRVLPGRDHHSLTSLPQARPSGESFDVVDAWNCLTLALCARGGKHMLDRLLKETRRRNQGIVRRQQDQELRDIAFHRALVARTIKKLNEQLEKRQINHEKYASQLNQLHDGGTAESGAIEMLRTIREVLRLSRRSRVSAISRIISAVTKKPWTSLIVGGVVLGAVVLLARKHT